MKSYKILNEIRIEFEIGLDAHTNVVRIAILF